MSRLDYVVLVLYFLVMTLIGVLSMLKVKKQEDFFLGSRTFGKIFQAFAAFGAGTGSYDPVTVGRTTVTSGLSGIWSVLLWLFVTPFYWITAVWYRRMRHITMGDWFVERYQSKAMGVAYMLFAVIFYMYYLALGFTAIGKVGAPLVNVEQVSILGLTLPIENFLVYICALVVLVYGVLGGLRAAYWTDLIQGVFIILLSVLLIPAGLDALVAKDAADRNVDPLSMSTMDGFRVMHEQVPDEYFKIVGSTRANEFPLYYIVAITLLNLVAIVVHPHMAVTGGGSAKSENSARVGLVVGNFLKRFCTIGWAITILIVLALMAGNLEITDPDRVWGVAAREILGPLNLGLVGLMLACLMAALMSSASAYMLIASALVVRNFYAAYIDKSASEKTYVLWGRIVGVLVILGGVLVSVRYQDVFKQLKIAWEMPILFAAIFWVGMFWRRATKWAAWGTVLFTLLAFLVVPAVLPMVVPGLATNPRYAVTNDFETTIVTRPAAPTDVAQRKAEIDLWEKNVAKWIEADAARTREAAAERFGPCPELRKVGQEIRQEYKTGGKSIYWTDGVEPVGRPEFKEVGRNTGSREGEIEVVRTQYDCPLQGKGSFRVDFLLYDALGLDMTTMSNAALETLRLPTRVILPFVVVILLSLVTPRDNREQLDRFYVKMKTPVIPDPEADQREMALSYEDPSRFDDKRLIKRFGLEIGRPNLVDIVGFVVCFLICFSLIWLTVWLANLGS